MQIAQWGGVGSKFLAFQLLLNRAYVAQKYHKIFYDFYLRKTKGEELVFVDGGAHAGVFSDVALQCGLCYAFEPNRYLHAFLKQQYKDNTNLILSPCALSDKNGKATFYDTNDDVVSQGSGIESFEWREQNGYEVDVINFADFLEKLIEKHGKIQLIKLDIEGAEFDVLDSLLARDLHKNVEFIMVETHERYFENPNAKISELRAKIKQKGANNIYLDWI